MRTMNIISLDPFAVNRGMGSCPSCANPGVVFSLDPFAYSSRGMGTLGLDAARQNTVNSLIQNIVAKGENCQDYLTLVDTYTRLSQKDKKSDTIAAAKEMAAMFQQKYSECVDRKATAAVQSSLSPSPSPTPTPMPTPTLASAAAGLVPTLVTTAQGVVQQYLPAQTTAQAVPVQQAAPTGWMTPKTLLMIGGGVLAIGLVVYLMRRK